MKSNVVENLYVHFPFCRRKCTYCALYSHACASTDAKRAYTEKILNTLNILGEEKLEKIKTVYFGGGSPALCDLSHILDLLQSKGSRIQEFSVELHPLDVSDELLQTLKSGGVNRISMGLQSTNDEVLKHMGRMYTFDIAEKAFAQIKKYFDNAGIDLIVGYPNVATSFSCSDEIDSLNFHKLSNWGLTHTSVYSLILEEESILGRLMGKGEHSSFLNGVNKISLPSDEIVLDSIVKISQYLNSLGLNRYEISNYAKDGFECQHNLSVWRGEDYYGIGDGAHGRLGLFRTQNWWGEELSKISEMSSSDSQKKLVPQAELLSEEADSLERTLFRLRTREGINSTNYPHWEKILDKYVKEGLLIKDLGHENAPSAHIYRLTNRGTEVCDSILAELI